ncbi:MAG: proprotein convertase P-domain-containing protein, partial [Bryobacteraceae bacterium]|nr:proprotein convertase P-domain-containing protein [Bryobacteraceae bacterium]
MATACDNAGHVYAAGSFEGTATIDSLSLVAQGSRDGFIIQLAADTGSASWARSIGAPDGSEVSSIAADRLGSLYVTGTFAGPTYFGQITLVPTFKGDVYVAKMNALGEVQWASRAGSDGEEWGDGVHEIAIADSATDPGQWAVYVAGAFCGTADFGSTTLSSKKTPSGSNSRDGFVTCLRASTGTFTWTSALGGPATESAYRLAADPDGGVYIAGIFTHRVDVDPGPGERWLESIIVGEGHFLVRLDEHGDYVSAWDLASYRDAGLGFVELDKQGMLVVGGRAAESWISYLGDTAINHPGIVIPPNADVKSTEMANFFVFKFNPDLTPVRGNVFLDIDQDGLRAVEPGIPEPGAVGQTVFIDLDKNGSWDVDEPTTVTRDDGAYYFNLPSGSYDIGVAPNEGWRKTSPASSSHRVVVTGVDPSLPVDAGDFGVWCPSQTSLYRSGGTPASIPGRSSTTTWTVSVADVGTVADVNVAIDLHGQLMDEIRIDLIGPDSSWTRLKPLNSSNEVRPHWVGYTSQRDYDLPRGEYLTGTIFDDEAAKFVGQTTPPYTDRVKPHDVSFYSGGLQQFRGLPAKGNWTLRISTGSPQDVLGTLNDWALELTTVQPSGTPWFSISDCALTEGSTGTTDATFTITLSA